MRRFTIVYLAIFFLLLMPGTAGNLMLTYTVSGENQPPVAVGGNITVARPGEKVFFSAAGSYDPDGEIVLYEWDFNGDGIYDWNSTKNGNTVHVYYKEGAYNATLRVTDNNGSTATDVYYVLIIKEDEGTDFERARALLTIVGIFEIAGGIGMIAIAVYLKRRLYDRL